MKYLFPLLFLCFVACRTETPEQERVNVSANAPTATETLAEPEERPRIVFFGNSLTAAYGLEPEQGFTAILQRRLDSLHLDYEIVNAGLSGETTSGGLQRIDWILSNPVNIFVLELGGNDGLRGTDPDLTRKNLAEMIDRVRAAHPEADIVLAGMEAPPNLGADYTDRFRAVYRELAREKDVHLIPFLLQDVGGIARLNLPDGIHPNVEGQQIVAENVWAVLGPLVR